MSFWSDTARYPDMAGMDARAIIPFSVWALHWSWNTFYIAVFGMMFFWITLRHGDSPETFIRKMINRLTLGDRSTIDAIIYRRQSRW